MGMSACSISVPTDRAEEGVKAVSDWVCAQGFDLLPETGDVPPRGWSFVNCEHERGLAVFRSRHWMVLACSESSELEAIAGLMLLLRKPVLELWLHDGDLWGYNLHAANGRIISSFC